ncbi:MAG: UvrB/UvrC motif-containing protein [Phycisphaerae bacterium]
MSLDISDILNDWPYDPGHVTVRKIIGSDGREKIQMRLDVGLLQMETTGRPDGKRPHDHESELAYQEKMLQEYRVAQGGSDEGFELDPMTCEELRAEGLMYYHRYLAEFVLEDFHGVERDTRRNLRLLDFYHDYACEEVDPQAMEQYRPYIVMMNTRAQARLDIDAGQPREALAALHEGIAQIVDSFRSLGHEELVDVSGEIAVLRAMARDVERNLPIDPAERLRRDLQKAVDEERYEDAADLRDRLRDMSPQRRHR